MGLMDFLQERFAESLKNLSEEQLLKRREKYLKVYNKTIFPNRKADLLRQIQSINAELERRKGR